MADVSEDAVGVALKALRETALDLIDACVKQHGEHAAQSANHQAHCTYLTAQEAIVTQCEALESLESRVRAECAAKVRGVPRHNGLEPDADGAFVYRDETLAALEAP